MALRLGTENKKQLYTVIALFAVILPLAIWEIYGMVATPSAPVRPTPAAVAPAAAQVQHAAAITDSDAAVPSAAGSTAAAGPDAQRLSDSDIDPSLHLDKLAESEGVEYAGTGRNIFSADSAPVEIPHAIAPPRPGQPSATQPTPVYETPKAPKIDLKYFWLYADQGQVAEGVLRPWGRCFHGKNRRCGRTSLQSREHPAGKRTSDRPEL